MKYLAAILPSVVIFIFIKAHDRNEKEPAGLLVKLFAAGALSTLPAIAGEELILYFMELTGIHSVVFLCFIGVALVEEGVKFAAAHRLASRHSSFDEVYDGIIYSVMVALGFATVENVLYVYSSGMGTAMARAFTAVPAHAIFGVVMGYLLSMAKLMPQRRKLWLACALALPTALHGLYDTVLFTAISDWVLASFIPLMIGMYAVAVRLVRKTFRLSPFADSLGQLISDQENGGQPISGTQAHEDEVNQ